MSASSLRHITFIYLMTFSTSPSPSPPALTTAGISVTASLDEHVLACAHRGAPTSTIYSSSPTTLTYHLFFFTVLTIHPRLAYVFGLLHLIFINPLLHPSGRHLSHYSVSYQPRCPRNSAESPSSRPATLRVTKTARSRAGWNTPVAPSQRSCPTMSPTCCAVTGHGRDTIPLVCLPLRLLETVRRLMPYSQGSPAHEDHPHRQA